MLERIRAVLGRRKSERDAAEKTRQVTPPPPTSATGPAGPGPIAWMTRLGAALGASRTAVVNGLLLIAALGVSATLVKELLNSSPVIQPVSLPEALVKLGYSHDGMATSIRAEVQKIRSNVASNGDPTSRSGANVRSTDMQLDLQLPGATFSMRAISRSLRDVLRLPDRTVLIEVRCLTRGRLSGLLRDKSAPSKARPDNAEDAKRPVVAECDLDHLSVEVVLVDAMSRGSMHRDTVAPVTVGDVAPRVAEVIAAHYLPALFAGHLLAVAQEAVANDGSADFEAVRRAYDRAELMADRERGFVERVIGGNPAEQKELAALGRVDVLIAETESLKSMRDAARQLKRAEAIARDVIKRRPRSGLAYAALGNVLFLLNRPDEALKAFELGAAADPDNFILHSNWANVLEERDPEQAVKHHRLALEKAPRNDASRSLLYANLGYGLLKAGKVDEAITSFETAQRRDPTQGHELRGLGESLLAQERTDEAMVALNLALEKRPNDAWALVAMTRAKLRKKDAVAALAYAEKAAKQYPAFATAHYVKAQTYEQLKRPSKAARSYETAIKLLNEGQSITQMKDASRIYKEYADLVHLTDIRKAMEVLRTGVDANRKSVVVRNNYAVALSEQERFLEAEAVLADAVTIDPVEARQSADEGPSAFANAYANLAFMREQLHLDDKALDAAERALQLDDKMASAWCVKGRVLARRAQTPESRAALEKGAKLGHKEC